MSNTIMIEHLTKCRINMGDYFNCISLSTILIALGFALSLVLILTILTVVQDKKEKQNAKS